MNDTRGFPLPVRLCLLMLIGCLAVRVSAATRVYPPGVLEDMGRLSKEAFDTKWPPTELEDGTLPQENGFWVAFRHLNLTILVGPYAEKPVAEEALEQMKTYRASLMLGDAQRFGTSSVGLLENRQTPGAASSTKLPPGPLPMEDLLSDHRSDVESPSTEGEPGTPSSEPSQQGGPGFGLITTPSSVLASVPDVYPPFLGQALETSVDLSRRFPPAGNQAPQNACAGWSIGYGLKSYHEAVEEGWSARSFWWGVNLNYTFSPAYLYNQINGGTDEGAMLPVCLALLQTNGVCRWPRMPFEPRDFTQQPSEMAHRDAKRYRIDFFGQVPVDNVDRVKGFLAGGFPLVAGVMTDKAFEALKRDQVWSTFTPGEGAGHAVIVVGYDDDQEAFKVFNSWGKRWGRDGYGWIAYDIWPEVALEVYAVKDAKNDATVPGWDRADFTVDVNAASHTPSGDVALSGTLAVPEAYPAEPEVVVVFEDARGRPVAGTEESFTTVTGQLGVRARSSGSSWSIDVPADAFAKQEGGALSAKAILYLDGFGLTASKRIQVRP